MLGWLRVIREIVRMLMMYIWTNHMVKVYQYVPLLVVLNYLYLSLDTYGTVFSHQAFTFTADIF